MLSLIQNDIMLAVLETENLYVYIYHHCHQYHHGFHSHRYCYHFYNITLYRYLNQKLNL